MLFSGGWSVGDLSTRESRVAFQVPPPPPAPPPPPHARQVALVRSQIFLEDTFYRLAQQTVHPLPPLPSTTVRATLPGRAVGPDLRPRHDGWRVPSIASFFFCGPHSCPQARHTSRCRRRRPPCCRAAQLTTAARKPDEWRSVLDEIGVRPPPRAAAAPAAHAAACRPRRLRCGRSGTMLCCTW